MFELGVLYVSKKKKSGYLRKRNSIDKESVRIFIFDDLHYEFHTKLTFLFL
jgi:hypothetical protein